MSNSLSPNSWCFPDWHCALCLKKDKANANNQRRIRMNKTHWSPFSIHIFFLGGLQHLLQWDGPTGKKKKALLSEDHPTLKTFSFRSLSGSETWFCISPHPRQLLHSSQWWLIQDNEHRYFCSLLAKITWALITTSSMGISAFCLAIWFCETWRKPIFCSLCYFTPILLELTKEFNREGQQDHNRTFCLRKADWKFAWHVWKQPNYLSWTSYHPSGSPQ